MKQPSLLIWAFAAAVALSGSAAAQTPPTPKMVQIPGGAYPMGADTGSAAPRHTVTLAPFRIDAFEVTNAQYADFLNTLDIRAGRDVRAGSLRPSDVSGADADRVWGRGNGRTYIQLGDEDAQIGIRGGRFEAAPGSAKRPVPETTWRGAVAYCAWRGARLPTEAEWEASARGHQGRTYPWGEAPPTSARAVFGRASGDTDPVGSHPPGATPEGVFDLAGNVTEWTASLMRPYPYVAGDGREDPAANGERVTRGGDHVYDIEAHKLTATFRDGFSRNPLSGHKHIGFRCAKSGVES
jgi:iron(II)-dependent oxidoreductase